VVHPVVARCPGRDAGFGQALAVTLAFIAQDVVFGGDNQHWRQSAQIVRAQRRDIGIVRLGLVI
jgi:hypothetical protein